MELKVDNILSKLKKEYNESGKKPVPFNFKKKTVTMLNGYANINKIIHYIYTYPGRISPDIAFYLLSLNEFKKLDGYVLDPFAGSGTILLESLINPVVQRPALGVEINPIARLISKVKTSLLDENEIQKSIIKIQNIYKAIKKIDVEIPSFTNINLWFSSSAKTQLAKLKFSIDEAKVNPIYKDFFWVSFAKTVRKVSKTDPNIPPPVLLKPIKYRKNLKEYKRMTALLESNAHPKVWEIFEKISKENSKLTELNGLISVPGHKAGAKIISSNAKEITIGRVGAIGRMVGTNDKKLRARSIDIILTSPPYLTAQKYIRSTKLELLWLGYTHKELSQFEKKTIGSESVAISSPIQPLDIISIDKLIRYAHRKSRGRGVMIYEYFEDMKIVLEELYRVLKNSGYAIFIMGDNVVLKRPVKTYRLLTDLAEKIGFKEVVTLRDRIQNRGMLPKRNGTGGLIKHEYIIILKK